jgi:hypothetical protein
MGDHYDGFAEADQAARRRESTERERVYLVAEGHYVFLAPDRRSQVCQTCGEPIHSDGYVWRHIKGIPTQAQVIALEGHLVEPAEHDSNLCESCGRWIDFAARENRYYHCPTPGPGTDKHHHLR